MRIPEGRIVMGNQGWYQFFIGPLILITVFIIFSTLIIFSTPVFSENWSEFEIMKLPDFSFALVEIGEDGAKLKHCPHHDVNGKLDIEQLIYVLGTFELETWYKRKNKKEARKHLEDHYQKFLKETLKEPIVSSLNINKAMLSQLVILPNVGPVIAVKILEYREQQGKFEKIEDIKKVGGIGPSTFNAIRHYIKID